MASKNKPSLDLTVEQYIGQRCLRGDIGIELELEGKLSPKNVSFWSFKEENSLRNGMEFVLTEPIPIESLYVALDALQNCLSESKPKLSLRTSTHFHVNVSRLTVREVYNFFAAYYLLEPLLVDTQPEKRKGNLFCLRMQDAESLSHDLHESLRKDRFLHMFQQNNHKYAALNLGSITRIGSVEFRFFEAILDMKVMEAWSRLLYTMVHRGKKLSPKKLLEVYETLSAKDFVRSLVGVDYADMIIGGMTNIQINKKLHLNYDTVFELAQLLDGKKFMLPEQFWNDDWDTSDALERPKKTSLAAQLHQFNQAFATTASPNIPVPQQWFDAGPFPAAPVPTPDGPTEPEPEPEQEPDDSWIVDEDDDDIGL